MRYKVLKFIVDQIATLTRQYWESATPHLADTRSRRLADTESQQLTNEPAYSRTCKDQSEANPAYSTP